MGATEAKFSATAPLSEVARTATYTHAYATSKGFLTLLSDGESLTGAYALGPEAGEWLQQATLAVRAKIPLEVLRDTIQPFPSFSDIHAAALKALRLEIAAAGQPGRCGLRMSPPVAIVTGASQGIGAGLVAGYRSAGYAVVGVAKSFPSAQHAETDYVQVAGDVADPQTARHAVDEARDRFGRLDTLINNAGIYIGKPFTEYTIDDYEAITAVNLTGFFHFTQLAIAEMAARGSGHS